MSVIIASVRPTVATASGPTRATKKTSTTAKTDSRTSSRTIGIASSTIARSMDPSVYEPWCDPASDSRIVAHRPGSGSGDVSDGVNLHPQSFAGETRDLHGGARRAMLAEHARVRRVHRLELAHVHQEHAAAQHVLKPGAGRLENGLHVLQALLGLLFDGVGDRSRHRIGAALAGDEDQFL